MPARRGGSRSDFLQKLQETKLIGVLMLFYISVILFWGLGVTLLSDSISLCVVQVRTAQTKLPGTPSSAPLGRGSAGLLASWRVRPRVYCPSLPLLKQQRKDVTEAYVAAFQYNFLFAFGMIFVQLEIYSRALLASLWRSGVHAASCTSKARPRCETSHTDDHAVTSPCL